MLSSLSQTPAPQAPAEADPIRDVSLADFMAEVIEASKQRLVIVDFWAPWCGPCKQLGPVLEKLVRGYKGAIRLAKIDIDQNPEIAQQMGVQSIPAVFAFFQARPVDGFMGALPEAQIKSWVERLIKATGSASPAAKDAEAGLKQAGEFLAAQDIASAQGIYADLLDEDSGNAAAHAGMLRCLIAQGDIAQAQHILTQLPPDLVKDRAFDPVRTSLELAAQSAQSNVDLSVLQKQLEKNPADHQTRFDLAMAHYAAGQKEDAVDQLLDIVRRARGWNDEAARKQLVKFFEAFGPTDPLTISARKRLSSILFS